MFDVNVVTVFLAASVTALATGLGALPFLLARSPSRSWLGLANALAAGFMVGASIGLLWEGWSRGPARTTAGAAAGVVAIVLTRRVATHQWPCPGDLLHIDSKRFSRFTRPGHAVTGTRDRTGAEKRMRVGHEFVHSLVDDHSRLAYSELHPDERAATVVGFVERGLAFFAEHGIQAQRLMSDNAWTYTHSRALRALLTRRGIRHLLIEKRRPQTNGKVERYQQTLKREWALGQVYRSSEHRAAALSHWLEHYNTRRPHSALGGLPPISRVHNVPRQDT